jgi:hypothetical protein
MRALLFTVLLLPCCALNVKGTLDASVQDETMDREDLVDVLPDDEAEDLEADAPDVQDIPDVPDAWDIPDLAEDPGVEDPQEEDPAEEEPPREDWLEGWARRMSLTIDHNDIDASLAQFPVLVHLSVSSGRNSADLSPIFAELGSDDNRGRIAVTLDDGVTQCFVEIDEWHADTREAWLWARVPDVDASSNTLLYLYYDAAQPPNTGYVGDTGTWAAEQVWEGVFRMVHHMKDETASTVRDSTSVGSDGAKSGAHHPLQAGGRIGWAQSFTDPDHITVSDSDLLDMGSTVTVEFWVSYEGGHAPNDFERILNKKHDWDGGTGWEISLETGYDSRLTVRGSSGAGTAGISNIVDSWAAGGWHYIAVEYEGSNARGYSEGAYRDVTAVAAVVDNLQPLYMGRYGGSDIHHWDGLMDEVRISTGLRGPAWIRATYESGIDDLIAFGPEELY